MGQIPTGPRGIDGNSGSGDSSSSAIANSTTLGKGLNQSFSLVVPPEITPAPLPEASASPLPVNGEDYEVAEWEKENISHDEAFKRLWEKFADIEDPTILRDLKVTKDGGLNDKALAQFWSCTSERVLRRCLALQMLAFVCYNVYYLIYLDIPVLRGFMRQGFLISLWVCGSVVNPLLPGNSLDMDGQQLIVVVELGFLLLKLCRAVWTLYRVMFGKKEHLSFRLLGLLFFHYIPDLSTFSAMRLLYFVTPSVLGTDVKLQFEFARERHARGRSWWGPNARLVITFVLSRIACLFIGLDAFLVKFREVAKLVNEPHPTFDNLSICLVFMFQVVGVVNLTWFVRKRLFIFIFGGPDGVVTSYEKGLEYFWRAALVKKLWEKYDLITFCIIMLSWSDYDFQRLVLATKDRTRADSSELWSPDRKPSYDSSAEEEKKVNATHGQHLRSYEVLADTLAKSQHYAEEAQRLQSVASQERKQRKEAERRCEALEERLREVLEERSEECARKRHHEKAASAAAGPSSLLFACCSFPAPAQGSHEFLD